MEKMNGNGNLLSQHLFNDEQPEVGVSDFVERSGQGMSLTDDRLARCNFRADDIAFVPL